MNVIKKNYARSVKRGSKTQQSVDKILGSMTPTTSYDSLGEADIVVEAGFENMDLKKNNSSTQLTEYHCMHSAEVLFLQIEFVIFFYLTVLKLSFGIIFSISFLGEGKSILFKIKTIPKIATKTKVNFITSPRIFLLKLVFLINCI